MLLRELLKKIHTTFVVVVCNGKVVEAGREIRLFTNFPRDAFVIGISTCKTHTGEPAITIEALDTSDVDLSE